MTPSTSLDRDALDRLARLEERVDQHSESKDRRIRALETIVYGFAGTVLLAVLGGIMALVIRSGGTPP